jgi:hypothetical protein
MDDNHLLYLTTAEWLKGYASGLDEHLHPALIFRLNCAADLLTAVWEKGCGQGEPKHD